MLNLNNMVSIVLPCTHTLRPHASPATSICSTAPLPHTHARSHTHNTHTHVHPPTHRPRRVRPARRPPSTPLLWPGRETRRSRLRSCWQRSWRSLGRRPRRRRRRSTAGSRWVTALALLAHVHNRYGRRDNNHGCNQLRSAGRLAQLMMPSPHPTPTTNHQPTSATPCMHPPQPHAGPAPVFRDGAGCGAAEPDVEADGAAPAQGGGAGGGAQAEAGGLARRPAGRVVG